MKSSVEPRIPYFSSNHPTSPWLSYSPKYIRKQVSCLPSQIMPTLSPRSGWQVLSGDTVTLRRVQFLHWHQGFELVQTTKSWLRKQNRNRPKVLPFGRFGMVTKTQKITAIFLVHCNFKNSSLFQWHFLSHDWTGLNCAEPAQSPDTFLKTELLEENAPLAGWFYSPICFTLAGIKSTTPAFGKGIYYRETQTLHPVVTNHLEISLLIQNDKSRKLPE